MQRAAPKYILILLAAGLILLSACRPHTPAASDQFITVPLLGYCAADQYKPCIVSFSTNAWDNMLINLLLPDRSFPPFHLIVLRGESEISYACQRLTGGLNNAYCAGPKLPPGEIVTLKLISNDDDTLLAQGDLTIIGLAFPTMEIALVTVETVSAEATLTATPTAFNDFILPPLESTPSPTSTLPGYPNPSYP
jgi:hypothetical protein